MQRHYQERRSSRYFFTTHSYPLAILLPSFGPGMSGQFYIRWTMELRDQLRKVFPFHQNTIPNRHQSVIRDMLVMMGGMYPSDKIHGVRNFE